MLGLFVWISGSLFVATGTHIETSRRIKIIETQNHDQLVNKKEYPNNRQICTHKTYESAKSTPMHIIASKTKKDNKLETQQFTNTGFFAHIVKHSPQGVKFIPSPYDHYFVAPYTGTELMHKFPDRFPFGTFNMGDIYQVKGALPASIMYYFGIETKNGFEMTMYGNDLDAIVREVNNNDTKNYKRVRNIIWCGAISISLYQIMKYALHDN